MPGDIAEPHLVSRVGGEVSLDEIVVHRRPGPAILPRRGLPNALHHRMAEQIRQAVGPAIASPAACANPGSENLSTT